MMKRFLSVLPALTMALCLAACTTTVAPETPAPVPNPAPMPEVIEVITPTPEPEPLPEVTFPFSRENMPRLDGSTSTAPLAQAMCAALLGEDEDAVAELIRFSRTTQSYRNLMDGSADLLLAAEPAPEVLAELEARDEFLLTPFATDALVFVVNADNPVDNLTTRQIQQIYTGEITNWKQVGGDDLDIVPFQRNAEAGSQTMFEKLVMHDQPLMEAPLHWTSDSMSGLLESVRAYDNSPSAIGYTVYYYANDMEMARGLKVLSVDGVTPSAEAIRAGDYPFLNPYYVAIRKDAPEESSIRAMYDWVLGRGGQLIAAREGYVPVTDVNAEVQTSSTIHPDLDNGRWYPQSVTELIPSENYGPLHPYVGSAVTAVQIWVDEDGIEHRWNCPWSTPVYGLMDARGTIVTDPVYQGVYLPTHREGDQVTALPLLLLTRSAEDWVDAYSEGQRYAVAARDGSWCTGFDFWIYTTDGEILLLLGPEGITQLDPATGSCIVRTWSELGIAESALPPLMNDIRWVYGFRWTAEGVFLGSTDPQNWEHTKIRLYNPEDGSIRIISQDEWNAILDAQIQSNWGSEVWDYHMDGELIRIAMGEQSYTLPVPDGMDRLGDITLHGDLAMLFDYSGEQTRAWLFRLSDSALLLETNYLTLLSDPVHPDSPPLIRAETIGKPQTIYTIELDPILQVDSTTAFSNYQDGMITVRDDETFFACYDAQSGECIFYRNLIPGDD